MHNWLLNFLENRQHCTKFDDLISLMLFINASIVQGSVIGPFAYVINASDLRALYALDKLNKYADDSYLQGWAQDLLGRDRDQDRDLSSRDRDETETFAKLSETRPRRDPRVSETRPRRDLFLVETISRHMAYKCMVYALHTVSQKKIP